MRLSREAEPTGEAGIDGETSTAAREIRGASLSVWESEGETTIPGQLHVDLHTVQPLAASPVLITLKRTFLALSAAASSVAIEAVFLRSTGRRQPQPIGVHRQTADDTLRQSRESLRTTGGPPCRKSWWQGRGGTAGMGGMGKEREGASSTAAMKS